MFSPSITTYSLNGTSYDPSCNFDIRKARYADDLVSLGFSLWSSLAKYALQSSGKKNYVLEQFRIIRWLISIQTLKLQRIACLTFGTTFLKSSCWSKSNCDKIHSSNLDLYRNLKVAIMPWSKSYTTLVQLGGRKTIVTFVMDNVVKYDNCFYCTPDKKWHEILK